MKNYLPVLAGCLCLTHISFGQVTQLNDNNSLEVTYAFSPSKTILVSGIDKSIWVSDGTAAGTVKIATGIQYELTAGVVNGKLFFTGNEVSTGAELYMTDGTTAGTVLVKDIRPGRNGSFPDDFVIWNNSIYFTASTPTEGRELWKSDGTLASTVLVKDINPGSGDSNDEGFYNLSNAGSYLLFSAESGSTGYELWKSDGTTPGTVLLKDINLGADPSSPRDFTSLNGKVLFFATDADHGEELWETNGTSGGTVLVKDINDGPGSSTSFAFSFFSTPVFLGFHQLGSELYFNASDGASIGEIWKTNGTTAGTVLVKDIISSTDPGSNPAIIPITNAINVSSKMIFPVSNSIDLFELWESDGTTAGTKVFKTFSGTDASAIPFIYLPSGNVPTSSFFQGNKFFFSAAGATEGNELWISDGTLAGTNLVADINPGGGNGIDNSASISYAYTDTYLFFAGTDGTNGNEVWKTDGTAAGTSLVQDVNPGSDDALPVFTLLSSGTLFFGATDGNHSTRTDLFIVNGTFNLLPLTLTSFTVAEVQSDALLKWETTGEVNTSHFTLQRSVDGNTFDSIGHVLASGNTAVRHGYTYLDRGISKTQRNIIYYRLISHDKDGEEQKSAVISLRLHRQGNWNVKVLGNPVRENVQLLLESTTEKVMISVFDINGRKVFSQIYPPTNGQVRLPLQLSAGTYVLIAESNNEKKIFKITK